MKEPRVTPDTTVPPVYGYLTVEPVGRDGARAGGFRFVRLQRALVLVTWRDVVAPGAVIGTRLWYRYTVGDRIELGEQCCVELAPLRDDAETALAAHQLVGCAGS